MESVHMQNIVHMQKRSWICGVQAYIRVTVAAPAAVQTEFSRKSLVVLAAAIEMHHMPSSCAGGQD